MSGRDEQLIRVMSDAGGAEEVLADRARRRRGKLERSRRRTGDRAELRLTLLFLIFVIAYGALGVRMTVLATSEPREPRVAAAAAPKAAGRRTITDRRGRALAMDLPAYAIYAHPRQLARAGIAPADAAHRLAAALNGVDEAKLAARLAKRRGLVWVKRPATPEERQATHDLGLPGVYFGRRETRIYPAGRIAAHVLGGARVAEETVSGAEIVGLGGVERALDEELRDPAYAGEPLALSLDIGAQTALTRVMQAAIARYKAKAGVAVLMDARNGEVVSLVSLPDFDPNNRPDPNAPEIRAVRPMMNRAAEAVYELGSTFKPFTAAQAIEQGYATLDTMIDTKGPLTMGRFRISDSHGMPDEMTLRDVIVHSSNVGTSRLALGFGPEAQRAFLGKFGFLEATGLEVAEARLGRPLLPRRWGRIETMTISFGHGVAVTPVHLAAGYAALVNGGLRVRPTLRRGAPAPTEADRVISIETSLAIRETLRAVVADTEGTGKQAAAPGYDVGGKTGTADKPKRGGYYRDRTLATFAAVFPTRSPQYVLIVTLDEASVKVHGKTLRFAGWTAAPVVSAAVQAVAPILGLRPAPGVVDVARLKTVEARQ